VRICANDCTDAKCRIFKTLKPASGPLSKDSAAINRKHVRIDTRWPASDPDSYRKYAAELVALGPDDPSLR